MTNDVEKVPVSFTGKVKLEAAEGILPIKIDGQDVTNLLWQLAGAFDGSVVKVKIKLTHSAWGKTHAIILQVHHDYLERPMVREILSVQDGGIMMSVMHNVEFYLRERYRGQGIGAYSLAYEAKAASELKFKMIVANAANHPDVGWRVWPKLGYDAIIEIDVLQKMHGDLELAGIPYEPGKLRISDLWNAGHYCIWEAHGTGCIMQFDVSSKDSWSMKRMREVITRKEK